MGYEDFRKKYNGVFDKAINNPAINNVYERILQNGWHYIIYDRLFFHREFDYQKKHPTKQMRISEEYFKIHESELSECEALLADEKSKQIFRQIIEFRYVRDRSKFPAHEINNQYFPKDIIQLTTEEVFVDCGACRGDTYRRFKRETKGQYKRVVCLETDDKNLNFLKRTEGADRKLIIVPKGAWSKETVLYFEIMGTKGTGRVVEKLEDSDALEVPVTTIDSLDYCKDATFIKMDIEGAEWEALHGAEQTIKRNQPKLAICLYHKDEDYIRLIKYIHNLNPSYKLHVRHHSTNTSETVLYAVM